MIISGGKGGIRQREMALFVVHRLISCEFISIGLLSRRSFPGGPKKELIRGSNESTKGFVFQSHS